MCPLRFILVFFSAVLTAYLAWKTIRTQPETAATISENPTLERKSSRKEEQTGFVEMARNAFWVFVDMASGKYLWRNLREMSKSKELKSS